MTAKFCIWHKIFCRIADIKHTYRLPVFRQFQKTPCLFLVKIADPDAAKIETCSFQHHVCGNDCGICFSTAFSALRMRPTGILIICHKQDKRRTVVKIKFSVAFVLTFLCQLHILFVVTKRTEFPNLCQVFQCIQHKDSLRLPINRRRRPPPGF